MKFSLSVVSPMHNEELCIEEFVKAVFRISEENFYEVEIVLVDDGSKDRTFEVAKSIAREDSRVKVIKLSRNFGHQMALFAGLKYAKMSHIVMMDSDLQHPPELIPVLVSKAQEGYEVVHTVRKKTHNETFRKKITSRAFYYLINKLSYTPIIPGAADFRLVSKRANDVFCSLIEFDRFNRGLFSWIGFNSIIVEYDAKERHAGSSSYTLRKMLSLALSSITSFSGKPLRISFYLGLMTMAVLAVYLVVVVYYFFKGQAVKGWSSLFFSITLLGSVQLISLGILGEYIFRIYNEVKRRPHFIIDQKVDED
jgi:glycosyltransferase involved in cell wall biosynthesis